MAFDGNIPGEWRPPATAYATPALFRIAPDGVIGVYALATGTRLAVAPLALAKVSDRIGQIPRRISFPDGSVFETPNNESIDRALSPHAAPRFGLVRRLEQFGPHLFLLVALIVASAFAIYRYAVPALVEVAILATPPIVPEMMSKGVIASLDEGVFDPTTLSAERQKAISDGFYQLASLTPRGAAKVTATGHPAYTLYFRKGGFIGPNAFALPDGSVVLTDELVELAGSDDELLLGVLGHEIGHVDHDHALRQLYRAAGVAALIMMIGGDLGGGTEDILVQGTALLSLSYSRDAERDADRYSVELMHRAGKDPAAIARFFELLSAKLGANDGQDFFSTHPATPDRIEATRKYAEEVSKGAL